MPRIRTTAALALLALSGGLAAAMGCADTDPRFGPPDAIVGREIDFGVDSGASAVPVEAGPPTKPAREIFDDLHVTIAGNAGTCLPCHATGGTGVTFFALPSSDASYAVFKQKSYQVLATANGFYARGAHSGPALTPAQQALTQQWAAAETGGGAAPAPGGGSADAGGGG